ncbi:unnamed protein product [Lampetra planeri]
MDLGKRKAVVPMPMQLTIRQLTEAMVASQGNSTKRQAANEKLVGQRESRTPWTTGHKAWLHCPQVHLGTSLKLHRQWQGPVEGEQARRLHLSRILLYRLQDSSA